MMFLSRTRPRPVSVLFFLNPHGPLSLTTQWPSRFVFLFFRFIFLFHYLHSPSLLYGFPGFSFFFWSIFLSSVRSFLSFRFLFLCQFSLPFCIFLFLVCWCWGGIYRAKRSGCVPIATLWQRMGSRALLPCHSAGLAGQWAWLARRGALDFSSSRCLGFRVFCKAHCSQELMKKEEEKCLPSLAAHPGEGERRTVSLKTTLFCFFFF